MLAPSLCKNIFSRLLKTKNKSLPRQCEAVLRHSGAVSYMDAKMLTVAMLTCLTGVMFSFLV